MKWRAAFSSYGRIARKEYWLIAGILLAASLALGLMIEHTPPSLQAIGILCFVPVLLVGGATMIKRLHDRNRDGLWALLPASWLVTILVLITLIDPEEAWIADVGWFVLGLAWLWLIIQCGFLRGSSGPNRYGIPGNGSPFRTAPSLRGLMSRIGRGEDLPDWLVSLEASRERATDHAGGSCPSCGYGGMDGMPFCASCGAPIADPA